MSKGLEALKDLENHFKTSSWAKETDFTMICFEIEKELKALDIVKKVVKYDVEVNGNEIFVEYEPNEVITKEEFELLKEVLG